MNLKTTIFIFLVMFFLAALSVRANTYNLPPDLSEEVGDVLDDLDDILDVGEEAIEEAINDLEDDVQDEVKNAIEAAEENSWNIVRTDISSQQKSIADDIDALKVEFQSVPSDESLHASHMQKLEESLVMIEQLEAELNAQAAEFFDSGEAVLEQLYDELAALKAASKALIESVYDQLQSEIEQWFDGEHHKAGEFLSMLTILDISSGLQQEVPQNYNQDALLLDHTSWSLSIYQTQDAWLLPLSFQPNDHFEVGIMLPLEQGEMDRCLSSMRAFATPWHKGYIEAHTQVYHGEESLLSWGAKVKQGFWNVVLTLDHRRGDLKNDFNFQSNRLGISLYLPYRQVLFLGIGDTTFTHDSLDSVIESQEGQMGYRFFWNMFELVPHGLEFDILATMPQRNVWEYKGKRTQLEGRDWTVHFGCDTRF